MNSMSFEDWVDHKVETVANVDAAGVVARAKASGATKVKRVPKPGSLNYSSVMIRWNAGSWARSVELKKAFMIAESAR